ncbi:hypothetical protein FRC03_009285, partial [Tulasnella sp. 419]
MESAYEWYFRNSPVAFPWTQEARQAIAERRAKLEGSLFIDKLFSFAEIDALAHYPPPDDLSLNQLLSLIQNSPFDDLKKNCLVYYLLKTYDDGREDRSTGAIYRQTWSHPFSIARPKPESLKALVSFPFTTFEDTHVINYALNPPNNLSDISIAVLHDLINVRLIHQGRYSEAIRLDRQFSSKFVGDVNGGGVIAKAAESRRISMEELVAVLPAVQRKLLEVELGPSVAPKPSTSNGAMSISGSTDLAMSWEMENSTSSLNKSGVLVPPNHPSTTLPPTSAAPISATPAFRQANPQVAVLQAFAQASSRLEGSLSPASRPSVSNAATGFASSKRLPPAKQAPFGMTPHKSALSASIMASSSTPPQKSLLGQPSNNSILSTSAFGFNTSNIQPPTAVANPFYRPAQPPQPDASFLNGDSSANGSAHLRGKRSFGQVAKSPPRPGGNFDTMDLDELGGGPATVEAEEEETDDHDDVVINPRRVDPRQMLAIANGRHRGNVQDDDDDDDDDEEAAPPPPPSPSKGRGKAAARSRAPTKAEKDKAEKPTKDSKKKGIPGAFPSGHEEREEEVQDQSGSLNTRRSSRKTNYQSDGERSSVSPGGRTPPPPSKTRSTAKPSRTSSAPTTKRQSTTSGIKAPSTRTTR